jgi:hypothetical protein
MPILARHTASWCIISAQSGVDIFVFLKFQYNLFTCLPTQVFYYQKVLEKALTMPTWTEFIYAFIKVTFSN